MNFDNKTNVDNLSLKYDKALNEILIEYYKYLNSTLGLTEKKSAEYIFYIVECLKINKEIKDITFENKLSCSGYYDNYNKRLMLNFDEMLKFYNLEIIDKSTLLIEFLTALFHEITHANQYKVLNYDTNNLISIMKSISLELKSLTNDDIKLHNFFPDEREANIISNKIIYTFWKNNDLENLEFINSNFIYYLTNGYSKKQISPMTILKNRIYNFNISEKIDINKISIYDKLIYGLSINDNLQDELDISNHNQTISLGLCKTLKL